MLFKWVKLEFGILKEMGSKPGESTHLELIPYEILVKMMKEHDTVIMPLRA